MAGPTTTQPSKDDLLKPTANAAPVHEDAFSIPIAPIPIEPGEEPFVDDPDAVASPHAEVFFFHLRDPFEQAIARAWLKNLNAQYRKAGRPEVPVQNLVDMIPLDALRRESRIIILARKGTSREPIREAQPVIERNDQGHLIHRTVPPAELAEDMKAYSDIRVARFWTTSRNRFSATDANYGLLVNEIATYASPYVPKYEDSADDKSNKPRRFLWLGWC